MFEPIEVRPLVEPTKKKKPKAKLPPSYKGMRGLRPDQTPEEIDRSLRLHHEFYQMCGTIYVAEDRRRRLNATELEHGRRPAGRKGSHDRQNQTKRRCLRCGHEFWSDSIGKRCCGSCAAQNAGAALRCSPDQHVALPREY